MKKNEIFISASNFKTDPFFSNRPDKEGKFSLSNSSKKNRLVFSEQGEKSKGLKNSRLFLKEKVVSSVNKQWIINTFPILSQQNSQGKV